VPDARQGDSANATFTWESRNTSGGAGAVSAYRTPGGGLVDLAAVGTIDWVHWGMTGKYAVNRRTATGVIPTWSEVGTPATLWYYSDPTTTFTWSGGSPTASPGAPTGYRVYAGDDGNGFRLVLPAAATPRTLHLYLGVFQATGRLTATLSDGSVAHLGSPVTDASGATDVEYVVTFASAAPGATLTLDWVQTQSFGAAQVNLQAAALR
jgi:hypothetical protein